MEKEKHIQSLFETARQEDPQLSFEEVSQNLEASLNPGMATVLKNWFFNHIYLNSFLVMVAVLVLSITVFTDFQTQDKESTISAQTKDNTNAKTEVASPIEIDKEPQTPIAKTLTKNIASSTDIEEPQIQESAALNPTIEPTIVKSETSLNLKKLVAKKPAEKSMDNIVGKSSNNHKIEPEKVKRQNKSKEQAERKVAKKETRSELEIILETALNSVKVKNDLFARNIKNEFNQLILLTNGEFDNLIQINFSGKKSIVLKSLYSGSFNMVNDEYVNVQDFKVEEKKAFLNFVYNSVKVQVELEKIDDIWICNNAIKDDHLQNNHLKQELLQMTFDDKRMNTVIEQDIKGNFNTFEVLANNQLSDKIVVDFNGEDLNIVPNLGSRGYNRRTTYMKITSLQIKRKKASFVFSYLGNTIEINYRKKDETWTIHSFKELL